MREENVLLFCLLLLKFALRFLLLHPVYEQHMDEYLYDKQDAFDSAWIIAAQDIQNENQRSAGKHFLQLGYFCATCYEYNESSNKSAGGQSRP